MMGQACSIASTGPRDAGWRRRREWRLGLPGACAGGQGRLPVLSNRQQTEVSAGVCARLPASPRFPARSVAADTARTAIEHALARPKAIGVTDAFSIPVYDFTSKPPCPIDWG